MTNSGHWNAIHLPSAPKLLLKSSFTATSYSVHLTDLSRMWSESLSKRDIIRRAWDDGCSIDPSEDDEQFRIFLDNVQRALDADDDTAMDILPGGEEGGLCVKLSVPLPKPLPDFVWTINLVRQNGEALARALTVPLLHQASTLRSQVQQLIHELHEKDRVIGKITDRLETSGNDLTTVFPGVSGVKTNKKKSQREQLAKYVSGLAGFDEAQWEGRSDASRPKNLWDGIDEVLGALADDVGGEDDRLGLERWWHKSKPKSGFVETESDSIQESANESMKMKVDTHGPRDESTTDEAFQRQATPAHMKRTMPAASDNNQCPAQQNIDEVEGEEVIRSDDGGDSTTEDEGDLDVVTKRKSKFKATFTGNQHDSPPNASATSAGSSRKLGAIGGRSAQPYPGPASKPSANEQTPLSIPRSRLGAIGGKIKPSASAMPASLEPASTSAPHKMGVIGGKRTIPSPIVPAAPLSPTTSTSEPGESRSRAPTKQPTPPPRETSQERADRKRDQLKKELEQKAKAPAKKKRKF